MSTWYFPTELPTDLHVFPKGVFVEEDEDYTDDQDFIDNGAEIVSEDSVEEIVLDNETGLEATKKATQAKRRRVVSDNEEASSNKTVCFYNF